MKLENKEYLFKYLKFTNSYVSVIKGSENKCNENEVFKLI